MHIYMSRCGAPYTSTLGGMKLRLAPHVIAGSLFVVPALLVAGIWYVYLFVAIPDNFTVWESVKGQLQWTFSNENPQFWMFVWLAALPGLCILMSVAYLSNVLNSRNGRVGLFSAAVALAIASFATVSWDFSLFVALPSLWGYRAIHAT